MTSRKKKPITPQYLYKNDKPVQVYLTIEDYKDLMHKVEKLAKQARILVEKSEKRKKT